MPLLNPELFARVGIKPTKGVLLYGPPGTGKTLLARAIASNIDAKFLKVVASAIVDKYIGESARVIREMFGRPPFLPILPSFFSPQVFFFFFRCRIRKNTSTVHHLYGRD